MAYQFPPDVQQLVSQQMAAGHYRSEDDLLRDALRALEDHRQSLVGDDQEVLQGIQRGLDEMAAGKGRPFEQFDAEFRQTHKLSGDV